MYSEKLTDNKFEILASGGTVHFYDGSPLFSIGGLQYVYGGVNQTWYSCEQDMHIKTYDIILRFAVDIHYHSDIELLYDTKHFQILIENKHEDDIPNFYLYDCTLTKTNMVEIDSDLVEFELNLFAIGLEEENDNA